LLVKYEHSPEEKARERSSKKGAKAFPRRSEKNRSIACYSKSAGQRILERKEKKISQAQLLEEIRTEIRLRRDLSEGEVDERPKKKNEKKQSQSGRDFLGERTKCGEMG